jgi:hypothetical protein
MALVVGPVFLLLSHDESKCRSLGVRDLQKRGQQPVAIVTGVSSGIGLGIYPGAARTRLARGGHLPYDQQLEGPYAFG